jgi:hypothetical protein
LVAFIAGLALSAAAAQNRDIDQRRKAERTEFTDAEILDGFMKITFGAELQVSKRVDRIRKYDGPVRVYVESLGRPDRRAQLAKVIEDIGHRIANLDIATTAQRSDANVTVTLVRDRDLVKTIRSRYGGSRAESIETALQPQCLSGFAKDESYRIIRSEVILVVDAGEFVFLDCAYEEMLQALGPINDDNSVPWTMFNDEVSMGYFGFYDQLLLNILYDPRIKPGMTPEEARAVLPAILPDVRAHVARINNIRHQ